MGVIVSKTSTTSPFFLSTGIIGIISFAFTLATFFRVTWENLQTLSEAPHEVHTYLTNLRQELLEERASLRLLKKYSKRTRKAYRGQDSALNEYIGVELDEVTIKTMIDSVRHLIRQFNEIEMPFLERGESGISQSTKHRSRRRGGSAGPYYAHSAYGSPPEKPYVRGRTDPSRDDDDAFWAQRVNYCSFTLWKRLQWLMRKGRAQNLLETLTRVQTRRTARQVGGMAVMMHMHGNVVSEMEEKVGRIDERMGRFVGVRRVE